MTVALICRTSIVAAWLAGLIRHGGGEPVTIALIVVLVALWAAPLVRERATRTARATAAARA